MTDRSRKKLKTRASESLGRAELVSIIAHLRGDLYTIRNAETLDAARETAEKALASSCFDVSPSDTHHGELAPIPELPCLNRRKR